jgi:hypothetical protein
MREARCSIAVVDVFGAWNAPARAWSDGARAKREVTTTKPSRRLLGRDDT